MVGELVVLLRRADVAALQAHEDRQKRADVRLGEAQKAVGPCMGGAAG